MVLVFTYLLHTTGELCLSPVGLSEITKLAPLVLVSTLMAVWFLSVSAAEYIGAIIAALSGSKTAGVSMRCARSWTNWALPERSTPSAIFPGNTSS